MSYFSTEIQRDGTSQINRLAEALLPEYIGIDERSTDDFLELIYKLSQHIVYYNNNNIKQGNWQIFFKDFADKDEIASKISEWEKTGNAQPHLSLLIAFLKLLEIAIGDLNNLTRKHLDFFYNRVLRIEKNAAEPNQVNVFFEIAKNITSFKLNSGTLLDAGKDKNGNIKYFQTLKEIVLNQAKISSLKSIYVENNTDYKIYGAPVTNSLDGLGTPFPVAGTAWKAFGESQKNLSDNEKTMLNADIGFAISSPALLLSEGERTIEINLSCRTTNPNPQVLNNFFEVYLSGAKAWIKAEPVTGNFTVTGPITGTSYYSANFILEIELSSTSPAITSFDANVLGDGFNTTWPVLKIKLNHNKNPFTYKLLKEIEIQTITINTTVLGIKNANLQNDQGILNPAKPFQPFGAVPRKGSSFIISSGELAVKNIKSVTISVLWDNLPADSLGSYFAGYAPNLTNSSFQANLFVNKNLQWQAYSGNPVALFHPTTASIPSAVNINSGFPDTIFDDEIISFYPSNSIKLELAGVKNSFDELIDELQEFGHQEFTNLYTNAAIEKANGSTTATFPNTPYTPVIKEFKLNYSASDTIILDADNPTGKFFRIEPFGFAEVISNEFFPLLESFNKQGNFYIGLQGLVPPQNVSILFQVAEGSGAISAITEADEIEWSYLSETGWQTLSSLEIITETTQNLQKSGIIEFSVGSNAIKGSTRFNGYSDYYWLRGSVLNNTELISKVVQLYPNAVAAEYVIDSVIEPDVSILPENTISKLVTKLAEVKKVNQPYVSSGGRVPETDTTYYTRVSERLRHKNRSVSLWDFEHMVLQEFDNVYKVKCLKNADAKSNLAPGSITLLVISNLRNKNASNPLEPTTSFGTLQSIKKYISNYVSPFVNVNVENPVYEKLLTDFKVGFYEGFDGGYYGALLNEEIKKFLSPWAYEEGKDILFGGKVYRSDILWFIENRPYVDYVTEFKLYHIYDSPSLTGIDYMQIESDFIVRDYTGPGIEAMEIGNTFIVGMESEIAEATTPRSILVSAQEHRIQVLRPGEFVCSGNVYDGIGLMAIEINFDVK
jgi:hypothetical protein